MNIIVACEVTRIILWPEIFSQCFENTREVFHVHILDNILIFKPHDPIRKNRHIIRRARIGNAHLTFSQYRGFCKQASFSHQETVKSWAVFSQCEAQFWPILQNIQPRWGLNLNTDICVYDLNYKLTPPFCFVVPGILNFFETKNNLSDFQKNLTQRHAV